MTTATETCSCGANITVTTRYPSDLRMTLQLWRKGHQHNEPQADEATACPECQRMNHHDCSKGCSCPCRTCVQHGLGAECHFCAEPAADTDGEK